MPITRIKVSNFRSFGELELDLDNLSVLIGANASGKSNLTQVFKLVRDIARFGLDDAISLQGGIRYLTNIAMAETKCFALQITYKNSGFVRIPYFRVGQTDRFQRLQATEVVYDLEIELVEGGKGFQVATEKAVCKCKVVERDERRKKDPGRSLGSRLVGITRQDGKLVPVVHLPLDKATPDNDVIPPFLSELKIGPRESLLRLGRLVPPMFDFVEFLQDIAVYDVDPKLPKKAVPIAGKADLEEDGSNLALVLKSIIEDEESRRKLTNLVVDALPFVKGMSVEEFLDKSLLFTVEEIYSPNQPLPAFLISDGTINITALVVALYLKPKPFVIIEEPERNIHPHLISKVADMLKDASAKRQVLVTTHNPELVKHVRLEDLLLISRDEKGFSVVTRPADNERVRVFLKNEIGIDELHAMNLLGGSE
ncbi:MAG: AAA family ATPase [Candidatus Coatesbacteria bacterium]|nr:AAA family ATPase [Candidatus Coatesbacteria bacterium]